MKINTVARCPQSLVEGFRKVETSTISDVLDTLNIQGVASGIRPISNQAKIVGPAVTVKQIACTVDTYTVADFCVADILDFAEQGDVLVFDYAGQEISTWGGLASTAAKMKGIAGTVIDGACRDVSQSIEVEYPVFSRHITPRSGKTRLKMLELNCPVQCGGVRVNPGDIIVADQTGVVVVPAQRAQEVLDKALVFEAKEEAFFKQLKKGKTFKEMQQMTGRL